MTEDEEREVYGKRVVNRGLFWKRLEGNDERVIWDPIEKDELKKKYVPLWSQLAFTVLVLWLIGWIVELIS